MSSTVDIINQSKEEIIKLITKLFSEFEHKSFDFKTGWSTFEAETQKCLKIFLEKKFGNNSVKEAANKNDYPDLKLNATDGVFAIDIKTSVGNVVGKPYSPAFDMARLDNFREERIEKFDEEWEVIIKYEKNTGKLLKVYFGTLKQMVGKNKFSGGVSYRRKDGNVRPKSWNDMEKGVNYWNTKEDFLEAIDKSFKYRWKALVSKILAPKLNPEDKEEFKKLFDAPIDLPEEDDEEQQGNEMTQENNDQ